MGVLMGSWRSGRSRSAAGLGTALGLLLVVGTATAADWPPISDQEWQLESLDWYPNAPAVTLLHEGTLRLSRISGASSHLEVYTRIKVLTEEGTRFGTVTLLSSDVWRLRDLEGRTHLPDGRVLELPENATFTSMYSPYYTRSVVAFVMPEVVPGAIIEFRYRRYFDSLYFPEPWFFESQLPTLVNRYVCDVPESYYYDTHLHCPTGLEVVEETRDYVAGTRVSFTAERVAPLPDEPARAPFGDLACRVTYRTVAEKAHPRNPILTSWRSVLLHFLGDDRSGFTWVRAKAGATRRQARKLAAAIEAPLARAEAVFAWVRDQVATRGPGGIAPGDEHADTLFKRREATMAQKAILLQLMLDAVDVESSLGLTASRFKGRVDPALVDPGQLDSALVVAEVEGATYFLDPSDSRLGFGHLSPELEGVECLLLDQRKERWLTTPVTPAAGSSRQARLRLELGAEGELTGSGNLVLSGHHAWRALRVRPTRDETLALWSAWLGRQLPGLIVEQVQVEEEVEARRVEVWWTMRRRVEEALADEVPLVASAPLSLTENPFTLPPERRRLPVLLGFADSNRVELELSWPTGWVVDVAPPALSLDTAVGELVAAVTLDPGGRRLSVSRVFTLEQGEVATESYADLHRLWAAIVAWDSEAVVLVRE